MGAESEAMASCREVLERKQFIDRRCIAHAALWLGTHVAADAKSALGRGQAVLPDTIAYLESLLERIDESRWILSDSEVSPLARDIQDLKTSCCRSDS